jgi:D-cysteine desulfhydrase/L-cysteate sulfo-lyase
VHFARDAKEQRRLLDELAAKVRAAGGRPHILNDNPMFDVASAIAYIEMTIEVLEQLAADRLAASCFYMSSSGKGQAGIILAQRLFNAGFAMHGVTATSEFDVPSRTASIANQAARTLGLDLEISTSDVVNFEGFVGERYGVPTEAGNEAVRLFARHEGIVLDPVYTGKCAAGMIAHLREGRFTKNDIVVFVHTGGMPAIFTWNKLWLDGSS